MLNSLLVAAMPLAPRFLVKAISKRYIAGEDTQAALDKCAALQTQGFETTLDILGESIERVDQARESFTRYLDLIEAVVDSGISRNISLKPTALGMSVDPDLAIRQIRQIVERASQSAVFIRIDMEDSPYTQQTLDLYESLSREFGNVGTVIQAYLHRSRVDVQTIASRGGNLRICKGIYHESPDIAYQQRDEIRKNYLTLIRTMLEQRAYVGIATHDLPLIEGALEIIRELGVSEGHYEFQALLGVPITHRLEQLISEGHRVRIYVPFGSQWYAYSSRRLKENPDIAGYVVRDLFRRRESV